MKKNHLQRTEQLENNSLLKEKGANMQRGMKRRQD